MASTTSKQRNNVQYPPQSATAKTQMPTMSKPAAAAEDYATKQKKDRANKILDNHQLLTRYAMANDLSVPKTRIYFEKLAAGMEPKPLIKNWNPLE